VRPPKADEAMSKKIQTFHIPRLTGTHADVFAAVGLADLLAEIPHVGDTRIVETEGSFDVIPPVQLGSAEFGAALQAPGYPFLKANEKTKVPKNAQDPVNYKAEKAKADRRKVAIASKNKRNPKVFDAETQELMQQEELRPDWRLLQVLNVLQGDETTNKVHMAVVNRSGAVFRKEIVGSLEGLFAGKPSGLNWDMGTVQLFTPTFAKGYSRLKPDSTDRSDKTKEQWADPFLEWLKYRGYFRAACPYFQGQKGEDVRVLCPVPHNIGIRALESVARELRGSKVYGASSKVDILAVLSLAELLIQHSEEYHEKDANVFPGLSLSGKSPREVISAVMTTHYQSLGSAKTVSAMSAVAVPGWFTIRTKEDATLWLSILGEHQRVVRSLQDDHSDEIGLLLAYRRFLEHRGETALWALVEFMGRYGTLIMRANGLRQENRIRWMTRFTDEYFRRVVLEMNTTLSDIMNDPGFEAIARAVRQATVTAQNKRARKEEVWREIRYDLLHDIHRTRQVPGNAFIECLGEFVSRYNYENARQREITKNPKVAPANISDEELKSFVALVNQHGASVVGALLAAYGTCKEKWDGDEQGERS
jgi:hypothetical protein